MGDTADEDLYPLGGMKMLAALALVLLACPRLPPPDGCEPFAYACRSGQPHICSGTRRWTPIGDTACPVPAHVCAMLDSGLAACVRTLGGDAP